MVPAVALLALGLVLGATPAQHKHHTDASATASACDTTLAAWCGHLAGAAAACTRCEAAHAAALKAARCTPRQLRPFCDPWYVGWWAAGRGGVPPMPTSLQSYAINRSVAAYFVSNNSGLASPAELQLETQLGIVGIGWNLFHDATARGDPFADPNGSFAGGGGLERYEAMQAAALKRARPAVGVMVTRTSQVLSTFFSAFRKVVNETDLWLQSPPGSGNPIRAQWGSDGGALGPTLKYYLNFSNPRARAWWLEQYIQPALEQPNIDGVYTDCSCGTPPAETFTQAEADGRQLAFAQALTLAKAKGKWFSAWEGPAVVDPPTGPGPGCVATMQKLIALGQNTSLGMQLATSPSFGVSQTVLAAFLLARGESAVIVLRVFDRPLGKPFPMPGCVDRNADPGTPLGAAVLNGTSLFTRRYTHAHVSLDCATMKSTIRIKERG